MTSPPDYFFFLQISAIASPARAWPLLSSPLDQTVTIHSAVSFLDELMVLLNYSHRDWRLYAVCCLSVAGNQEQKQRNRFEAVA